jgi:thioredoxin-related protein
MKDKWINDIFNEKVIMELSNPSMYAITGNPLYERSEKEIKIDENVKNKLRNISKNTQNLLTLFESQGCEIEPWIEDEIKKVEKIINELSNNINKE